MLLELLRKDSQREYTKFHKEKFQMNALRFSEFLSGSLQNKSTMTLFLKL